MLNRSEFPDIDWTNKDVNRLVEIFDIMAKKKDEIINQLTEMNNQQAEEIKQLKQKIEDLTSGTEDSSVQHQKLQCKGIQGLSTPLRIHKKA